MCNPSDPISVKTNLIMAVKDYLTNVPNTDINQTLDVLKSKYGHKTNDYNFIEYGIRANLQNRNADTLSNIGKYILPLSNTQLLQDLLCALNPNFNFA